LDARRGPSRARNVGAASAVGDYLVFIDADVRVHRDTLSRFVAGFSKDPQLGAIIGAYDDSPADPGFLSQYKNLFHRYIHQCSKGMINTFWSGCGAMRRDLFLGLGGFNAAQYREASIEDIELGMRAEAGGVRIILDSRIQGKHLKRWTFWNLVKTDIFDRGIPWMRLILRRGVLSDTLNLKRNQRISVVLAYVTGLSILASLRLPSLEMGALASAAAVTVMNLDLYRFFMARKGAWFTIRVLPMHWLYLIYCGACFWVGVLLYLLDVFRTSEMKEPREDRLLAPDDSV
jgi:glycosyltransferase involved in cell wall biosynthesis